MIKVTCDKCQAEISMSTRVEVRFKNGVHPHNGSDMYTTKDLCGNCAAELSEKSRFSCQLDWEKL